MNYNNIASKEFNKVGDDKLFPNHTDKCIWVNGFKAGLKWYEKNLKIDTSKTPMQQLQDLLRKEDDTIHTEDLLQMIGYLYIERERELIKHSCIMAIMQWHEWDKTKYKLNTQT